MTITLSEACPHAGTIQQQAPPSLPGTTYTLHLQHPSATCPSAEPKEAPTRYSEFPVYVEVGKNIYYLLFKNEGRSYASQWCNFVSSTAADESAPTSIQPIGSKVCSDSEVHYYPQLEVKISRLIHSHFLALALFFNSTKKGYHHEVSATCLQFGVGLGKGRQGLHSNLLPGLTMEVTSQKNYKHHMRTAFCEYLRIHFELYQKVCQDILNPETMKSHEKITSILELLSLDPFNLSHHVFGITIQKISSPLDLETVQGKLANTALERMCHVRVNLEDIRTILTQHVRDLDKPKLNKKLLSLCKKASRDLSFLSINYCDLRTLMNVSALKISFTSTHFYAENNRVDDMPRSLNEWDSHFLEGEFRAVAEKQLSEVSRGILPQAQASVFIKKLKKLLENSIESIREDLMKYREASIKFEQLKSTEREFFNFFRKKNLKDENEIGFNVTFELFKAIREFEEDLSFLEKSKINPIRKFAKELSKNYSSHKENILNLYKYLYMIPHHRQHNGCDEAQEPKLEELITHKVFVDKESFSQKDWNQCVASIQNGKKTPLMLLMGSIESSQQRANFNSFETIHIINQWLKGFETDSKLNGLPEYLSSLEPIKVISWPYRHQIQQLSWDLLLDQVLSLTKKNPIDLTEGEKTFLDLLNIEYLNLSIDRSELLDGPFLMSQPIFENMGVSIQTLEVCSSRISNISKNAVSFEEIKSESEKAITELLENYPRYPLSEYDADRGIINALLVRLRSGNNLKWDIEIIKIALEFLLQSKIKSGAKSARATLDKIDRTLKKAVNNHQNLKTPYSKTVVEKAQRKKRILQAFYQKYKDNGEGFHKATATGEFFLEAANIEKTYPGSVHPMSKALDVSSITPESLGPPLSSRMLELFEMGKIGELHKLFSSHRLDKHELVLKIKNIGEDKEKLVEFIDNFNHTNNPHKWEEVLQHAFVENLIELRDANELDQLKQWTVELAELYEAINIKAHEKYVILRDRLHLSLNLIEIFQEIMNDPAVPESEITRLIKWVNDDHCVRAFNGAFLQSALTFFTKPLPLNFMKGIPPETHEGIPYLWARISRFLKFGDPRKAELHLIETAKASLKERDLGSSYSFDEVEKADCLASNPFDEYQPLIEEFGSMSEYVIPYYQKIVDDLDDGADYEKILKKLIINELDIGDFYGAAGDSGVTRERLYNLPLCVLSSLLAPTVSKRTHRYEKIDVEKDSKVFQTLYANPDMTEWVERNAEDLVDESPYCTIDFLRHLAKNDKIKIIKFKKI